MAARLQAFPTARYRKFLWPQNKVIMPETTLDSKNKMRSMLQIITTNGNTLVDSLNWKEKLDWQVPIFDCTVCSDLAAGPF
jgi:hypothetical protein